MEKSELHKTFDQCELISQVKKDEQKHTKLENVVIRERAKAIPFLGSMTGRDEAPELNMDHVYIKFLDFLWGFIFIGPMSYCLWLKGTFILRLRIFCIRRGWMNMKENKDIEGLIATFCLEQTQVINYCAKTKGERGNIAGFYFADFPYVDSNLKYRVADLFAVDINLDTKKFVKARLDDSELSASDTFIFFIVDFPSSIPVPIPMGFDFTSAQLLSIK